MLPNYYQPQYSTPYTQSRVNNGITWVQGIEGAKAYQLMPNSNTILMDSDTEGVFYIKVSDNIGMCTLRVFKYEEVTQTDIQKSSVDTNLYITKDEFDKVISELRESIHGKQSIQSTKSIKPDKSNVITE